MYMFRCTCVSGVHVSVYLHAFEVYVFRCMFLHFRCKRLGVCIYASGIYSPVYVFVHLFFGVCLRLWYMYFGVCILVSGEYS